MDTKLVTVWQGHKSRLTIWQGHNPRLTIRQGHKPRLTIQQGHKPRLTIQQGHKPRLTIRQGHKPRLTIQQGHKPRLTIRQGHKLSLHLSYTTDKRKADLWHGHTKTKLMTDSLKPILQKKTRFVNDFRQHTSEHWNKASLPPPHPPSNPGPMPEHDFKLFNNQNQNI